MTDSASGVSFKNDYIICAPAKINTENRAIPLYSVSDTYSGTKKKKKSIKKYIFLFFMLACLGVSAFVGMKAYKIYSKIKKGLKNFSLI